MKQAMLDNEAKLEAKYELEQIYLSLGNYSSNSKVSDANDKSQMKKTSDEGMMWLDDNPKADPGVYINKKNEVETFYNEMKGKYGL